MADDLGSQGDSTFREGGALDKLYRLAGTWEERAKKAERARRATLLERGAWFIAGALVPALVLWARARFGF